jgi:phage tail-like protein
MSCASGRPTFRLLDRRVGWIDRQYDRTSQAWVGVNPSTDTAPTSSNLTPWNDPGGIRLSPASSTAGPSVVDPSSLLAYLPPRRLALGCGPGSWRLLTPGGRVLRWDGCTGCWLLLGRAEDARSGIEAARALAASPSRFAIAGARGIQVYTASGEKQVAEIPVTDAECLAFSPGGDLLVASPIPPGLILLRRYDPTGLSCGQFALPATIPGPAHRLAVDVQETVWLVTGDTPESQQLWSGPWGGPLQPATIDALAAAFAPNGLTGVSRKGFCLQVTGPDEVPETCCFSWEGRPIPASSVPPAPLPALQPEGYIISGWIDSGIPRCRWHRIRVVADVPKGSGLEIGYVTTDFNPADTAHWEAPSDDDWQWGPPGAVDILVNLPAGRYLKLRLNFTGDGTHTAVVWSVRIDFPRRTSLDWLPAVYRENPEAEDFTERFLANFDASIQDIDAAIARFPAMLAVASVPGEVLPWLGSFLDVTFDPDWSDSRRRDILNALPTLYRHRGTLCGLTQTIHLIFGVTPAIRELGVQRSWGALADSSKDEAEALVQPNATVGAVRLFGKARARFRLGHSALGAAPLRGYGNPDLDPLIAEAYRFEVQIPRGSTGVDRGRLTALIASQKPAHTAASVRFGGDGFVVGVWSSVGIDTSFTPLPQPVVGASGNIRLRRASLVAASPARGRLPLVVGLASAVGVHTLLE